MNSEKPDVEMQGEDPSNPSGRLHRILEFHWAVRIFTRRELYFANPASKWQDPYEQWVAADVKHTFFAQCWTKILESDALWRIYSPNNLGVKITTTRTKLRSAVYMWAMEDPPNRAADVADVRYRNQLEFFLPREELVLPPVEGVQPMPQSAAPLLDKRMAFKHEAECRALLWKANAEVKDAPAGVTVSVNPFDLIESITVDPHAPNELAHAMLLQFRSVGFTGRFRQSHLYRPLPPIG